jgi:hypothetical protein
VIVEESNRVENAIVNQDGLRRILRAGHGDFEFQVAAFALLLVFQRMAIVISDRKRLKQQRIIKVLRRVVFDGYGAVDSVPETGEVDFDNFRHFNGAIGIYRDGFIEVLNCEIARDGRQRSKKELHNKREQAKCESRTKARHHVRTA